MKKIVFSLAILLSSFLLFMVQPMVGRMLLPSLGGTPAVWNTCVVFFQAVLLLGYGYAHYCARKLSPRRHVLIHWFLLGAVCFLLPIQLVTDWAVPTESNPLGWLIGQLFVAVGIPFFVISSNAPLLQRWYTKVSSGDGRDPYFLYATSNVGSLGALLAYPFLVEPIWGITAQTVLWLFGFLSLAISFAACGWFVIRAESAGGEAGSTRPAEEPYQSLAWFKRAHYITLAAIPSSLMLGVTTFITTDVGSFPLMWVLPLAVYLLTFILVFAQRQLVSHQLVVRILPLLLLLMPVVTLMDLGVSPLLMIGIHLTSFFFVAMMCHGEMARLRPPAEQLTEFYLMMSMGGVIGGAFNALLAPMIFNDVFEYPLMLIAAATLMPVWGKGHPPAGSRPRFRTSDLAWAAGLVAFVLVAHFALTAIGPENEAFLGAIMFGIPAMVCFSSVGQPIRFALCYAVMVVACSTTLIDRETLAKARGFFGVNEVALNPDAGFRSLINGRTLHGIQRAHESQNPEPLSYFHQLGPMGDIFEIFPLPAEANVGIVGLGIGSIASYARPAQHFDFYEIDPVVSQMAHDKRYFGFLSSCQAKLRVILGDARIQLAQVSSPSSTEASEPFLYHLLILDAFSSDSIPNHLLTQEAMQLYLERLEPNGLLTLHITNKFVDLRPLVVGLANHFQLAAAIREDRIPGDHLENDGRLASTFVVLSRQPEVVEQFLATGKWMPVHSERRPTLWTDEHTNILDILNWY